MKNVLSNFDLALMSERADAERIVNLGCDPQQVFVTGNVKFDLAADANGNELVDELQKRFGFAPNRPLIIAASTHEPEEKWILEAFKKLRGQTDSPRLMIAPRHPERFAKIAQLIKESGFTFAARSKNFTETDKQADIILLDSIGELRHIYSLATLVFVGGSLCPHGGQNMLEPIAAQRAVVAGFYTMNFAVVVKTLLAREAIVQLPELEERDASTVLARTFFDLLSDKAKRDALADNAFAVLQENRGATKRTIERLQNNAILKS